MIKKWMWVGPLSIISTGVVVGAVVGGYISNQNSDPYRLYSAVPTGSSNTNLIQTYFASIVNGSKLLMLPGYTHTIPLTQALGVTKESNKPMYNYMNKAGFVLLDDSYGVPIFNDENQVDNSVIQPVWSTQVASMKFRTDLGSFLTGIAVAEFLNEYQYYFAPNEGDKLTWATYGGATFSSVTGYMGGLQRGIRWFNENIVPGNITEDGRPFKEVEQVFLGDTVNSNFANGFGATDGNQLITNFLQKNVNLLVPVAGTQTQQAVRLINQLKKRTIVLGVDTAAEDDTNTNLSLSTPGYETINGSKEIGGTNKIVQFSSLKKLDVAGSKIMQNIDEGIEEPVGDSTIGGFGYQSLGTTNNDCVGVSPAGYPYFIKAIDRYQEKNNPKIKSIETLNEQELTNAYKNAVSVIEKTDYFQSLNEPENKVYYAYPNWKDGEKYDDKKSWSYADLPNQGSEMMPLNINELPEWFKSYYSLSSVDINQWSQEYQTRYYSLIKWFNDNEQEINIRKEFNLKGELTKENYEKDKSLIKVVTNSPDTPLLDKSFAQTTYMGLVEYWKKQGINLPIPKG